MRAADSDRERVAEVLRQAAGDGRLTLDELDERLGQVYSARTYAELEPLTSDLPQSAHATQVAPAADDRVGGTPTSHIGIAIMGGFRRSGHWVVPRNFSALALMGGGTLDLRDARFAEQQVTIRALAVMGGVEIVVPQDAEVHVHGIGIMGGINQPSTQPGRPGAPRIVVVGLALMGGIDVKRKPAKDGAKRKHKAKELPPA